MDLNLGLELLKVVLSFVGVVLNYLQQQKIKALTESLEKNSQRLDNLEKSLPLGKD